MQLDPKKVKPQNKWVLIKSDPRVKQTKGGIHLTEAITGVERVMEGTGHILGVGRDVAKEVGFALEPGMRVCFRGFLKDTTSGIFQKIDDCEVFMLRAEDVLMVIEEDVTMGAFG